MSWITEPHSEYNRQRAHYLTSHALADFRRCPRLFHRKHVGLVPDLDSSAYKLGRALHVLTLEGRERFDQEFCVGGGPINEKTGEPFGIRTKAYLAWKATETREVLTDSEAITVESMAAEVASHAEAYKLLSGCITEATLRSEWYGLRVQVRFDAVDNEMHIGIDLKTCDNIDRFEKSIRLYGYDYQAQFYKEVYWSCFGRFPEWYWIAVEKQEPFRVGVFKWNDGSWFLRCHRENDEAVKQLIECSESDNWPTGYEEVREVRGESEEECDCRSDEGNTTPSTTVSTVWCTGYREEHLGIEST